MKINVFNENGYPLAASKSKFAFQILLILFKTFHKSPIILQLLSENIYLYIPKEKVVLEKSLNVDLFSTTLIQVFSFLFSIMVQISKGLLTRPISFLFLKD